MAEPNRAFWSKQTEYSLEDAAFLLCDLEPEYPIMGHPAWRTCLREMLALLDGTRHRIPHRTADPNRRDSGVFFTREGLKAFAQQKGITAPFLIDEEQEVPILPEDAPGARDRQLLFIRGVIVGKGWDPLKIPNGGKVEAKRLAEQGAPDLFTGSDSFDNAWSEGKRREFWRTENRDTSAKR
jgi:hypothetical protein